MSKKLTLILFQPVLLRSSLMYLPLFILFFLSGCAALIYQIMWERILFTSFGVDLQSITIIVSVFMFGLSIGSLSGGYLAELFPNRLLFFYILFELVIAGFGFLSPWLLMGLGNHFFTHHALILTGISFLILALPTILMGATFPILVKEVNASKRNIGETVGLLYMANTLGSAIGAYFAGFILLYSLTISGSIYCAASLNLAIAFSGFALFRK